MDIVRNDDFRVWRLEGFNLAGQLSNASQLKDREMTPGRVPLQKGRIQLSSDSSMMLPARAIRPSRALNMPSAGS